MELEGRARFLLDAFGHARVTGKRPRRRLLSWCRGPGIALYPRAQFVSEHVAFHPADAVILDALDRGIQDFPYALRSRNSIKHAAGASSICKHPLRSRGCSECRSHEGQGQEAQHLTRGRSETVASVAACAVQASLWIRLRHGVAQGRPEYVSTWIRELHKGLVRTVAGRFI
jgi:hypothetical protein